MKRVSHSQLNTVTSGITVPGAGGGIHTVKRPFLRQNAGGSGRKYSPASHPIRDLTSVVRPPVQGSLQQYLGNGEYPLFQFIAMFESCFIQVTRKGKQVFIHNNCNQAIVGIATTNPSLPLPNIMFIARPGVGQVSSGQHREELMLTRLIPLKFVRISIHSSKKHLIKIKLINRRSYYLQLYSSTEDVNTLFDCWLSLIRLLHHPPRSYLQPRPKSCTIEGLSVQVVPSEIDTKLDDGSVDIKDKVLKEDETVSLPLEMDHFQLARKTTKINIQQSQENIMREAYTKSEDHLIRMKSKLLTPSKLILPTENESYESYEMSTPPTADASMRYSISSMIFSDDSDLTLSRCSLPTIKFPGKGDGGSSSSSSIKIVTIFSVVSEHAELTASFKAEDQEEER